jgi:integrase
MRPEHVNIISRHAGDCPDRSKGETYLDCKCRKSLRVFDPILNKRFRVRTGERDRHQAEQVRIDYLNSNNPRFGELITKAEILEREQAEGKKPKDGILIEDAIVAYITKLRSLHRAEGTIVNAESLLGYSDPKSSNVIQSGKFLKWINGFVWKPTYLTDVTPELIESFVATWQLTDTTENSQRQRLKAFFKFCVRRKWLASNPCETLDRVKVRAGNRTAAFTPEQYASILEACRNYETSIPGKRGEEWKRRLLVFVRLMRESGMSLVDAVLFNPACFNGDSLSYRRKKTQKQTWAIPISSELVADLRRVPDQYGVTGSAQPFRTSAIALKEDCRNWRLRIKSILTAAGITTVKTDIGERPPHPHMFRDTFAIELRNAGVPVENISKMLGHGNTLITENHYFPKDARADDAHLAIVRKAIAASQPKPAGRVIKMRSKQA